MVEAADMEATSSYGKRYSLREDEDRCVRSAQRKRHEQQTADEPLNVRKQMVLVGVASAP